MTDRMGRQVSLVHRAAELVRARAQKALNDAEDPVVALDYAYAQAQQQLQEARAGLATMATAVQTVRAQDQKFARQLVQLDGQASRALNQGREDLAREALTRKVAIEAQRAPIQQQLQQLEAQQTAVEEAVGRLQKHVQNLATQKEVLKAQLAAGTAAASVNDMLAGIGDHMDGVSSAYQRAQERVDGVTARAAATQQLIDTGVLPAIGGPVDDIEAQLIQSGPSRVDELLDQMRQGKKLPPAPQQRALPPSHNEPSSDEMEGWM